MSNEDDIYRLKELTSRTKKDSRNVYQFFSLYTFLILLIAAYVMASKQYIAGTLLLILCFIGFCMLFPAQQVTKDTEESDKIIKRLFR